MNEYAGREKAIEATVKEMREGGRTKIAGIDTFVFSPKLLEELLDTDIPYLLAQLREAREKLEAVEEYARYLHDNRDVLDSIIVARDLDRILKGGD